MVVSSSRRQNHVIRRVDSEIDKLDQKSDPLGHFVRIGRSLVLSELDRAMLLERREVHLETTSAQRQADEKT